MIDTPQMYFAINHLGTCGGVQVTASHNPTNYNGFKISGLGAKPVGADTGLKDIQHIAMALLHTKAKGGGTTKACDLIPQYKNHVLKFLRPSKKKLKIAIDASNGMAGKMVPAIFSDLPTKIISINFFQYSEICFMYLLRFVLPQKGQCLVFDSSSCPQLGQ